MSELQDAVNKLTELTNKLEVDAKQSMERLRELVDVLEVDGSSIDEFEAHLAKTIKNLREFLGETNG